MATPLRTAAALEKVIDVLEKESESMEVCRAECAMLSQKNIADKDKERLGRVYHMFQDDYLLHMPACLALTLLSRLVKKLDEHLHKTTVACLVNTSFQRSAQAVTCSSLVVSRCSGASTTETTAKILSCN